MSQVLCNRGNSLLGCIDIRLHFAQRNRTDRQISVAVEDRIVRILPSLLNQTVVGLPRILYKAIAVLVAVAIDPLQRSQDVRPDLAQKIYIRCALVVSRGEDDKERRSIDGSVIVPEWHFTEARHLTLAHFVQNFSGVRIPGGIMAGCLGCSEIGEHTVGDRRHQPKQFERSNNAVSSKHSAKPWHTCVRIETVWCG